MKQTPQKPKKSTPKEKDQGIFKKPLPPASQKKRTTPKEKSPDDNGDNNQQNSDLAKRPKLRVFQSNYTSVSPCYENRRMTDDLQTLERDDREVYGLTDDRHAGPSNRYYSDQPPFLTPRDANPVEGEDSGDEGMEQEEEDEEGDDADEDEDEEEDVDSCGEIDEEVAAVVERLSRKMEQHTLESIHLVSRVAPQNVVGDRQFSAGDNNAASNTSNEITIGLTVKLKNKKTRVPAHYIYQLFSNEALGYGLIDRKSKFVTAMRTTEPGEINETQEFLCDPRYTLLFKEFVKNLNKTPEGQFITLFDGRFVLVKRLAPLSGDLPKLFNRGMDRDPARDPPIFEEIVERVYLMPEESTVTHPKAHRWPPEFNYTMIEYAEDPFWTERTIPIPVDIMVPPKPLDYDNDRDSPPPPPEDYNWVPPPGECPIPIPPEAWRLYEERKAEHQRRVREEQEEKEKQKKEESRSNSSAAKKAKIT